MNTVKQQVSKNEDPITIEAVIAGGAFHGGAWKVAYADFVTAMMAFFLLLWLLNVSTDEQREAISNYFDPTHPKISDRVSGSGGLMGGLSMSPQGAQVSDAQPLVSQDPTKARPSSTTKQRVKGKGQEAVKRAKEALRKKEEENFKAAEQAIKKAIENDPNLKELAKNLIIDMTPEGLRIQIVDQDGRPMFASGSANMFAYTEALMQKIAGVIQSLPNELSIRGHTDSMPYGSGASYTNWELSTDRANSSRRVFKSSNISEERINNVVGKADTEPLLPEDPANARNRRISVVLLKQELTDPDYDEKAEAYAQEEGYYDEEDIEEAPAMPPIGTFRKTPGAVEFP